MDINITSKYLEQNKKFRYIEVLDILNASGISNVSDIQIVLKKNDKIIFNKIIKLYNDFKIYIDDEEHDIYELTQNYFPLMGNDVERVDIQMNIELTGTQENKIRTIKIYHHKKDTMEDIEAINKRFK